MKRKKILMVTSRVPWPLDKGDKLRAYHQLKFISKFADVYLFSINDKKSLTSVPQELSTLCKELKIVQLGFFSIVINLLRSVFTSMPFQVGYFYNQRIRKEFEHFADEAKADLIFAQLIRTVPLVEARKERKVLDYMDVFSKGMERRLKNTSTFLKPIFKLEQMRLRKYERDVFSKFDERCIISEQDKNLIYHDRNRDIHVVANGVDFGFFHPQQHQKEFEILFNGNMNYPPNVEAALYLCNKILPIIHKSMPGVKVLISGTSPSQPIRNLASELITVSGFVSDVRDNFSKSMILVAPMQSSIGLQNKLLEAMAMGLPCVTSTLANNALQAKIGEQILVADTPETYATTIIDLLRNESLRNSIAHNALLFVQSNYSWDFANQKLLQLLQLEDANSPRND
jgi:polysaccharide biosynthesis protein PslH